MVGDFNSKVPMSAGISKSSSKLSFMLSTCGRFKAVGSVENSLGSKEGDRGAIWRTDNFKFAESGISMSSDQSSILTGPDFRMVVPSRLIVPPINAEDGV